MRTPLIVLLFLAVVLSFAAPPSMAETQYGEWELVMDKNGIKAYSRKVEGSGIFEFRAVAVVDAPIEVVGETLRDVPACAEWLPYCNESRLLEMKDRNHFSTYVSLDLPWPLKDRDLTLGTETEYDLVHGRAVTDLYNTDIASCPITDSHIRMPCLKGQYVFEFITRERTGIIQTYRADLAGKVPDWMANIATKYNMYDTFMNLKEMFKKEKYIELAKKSPDLEICLDILANKNRVKEILVARLKEFINDEGFIAMILADRDIDRILLSDNGKTSETILYGWGSDESKKSAIKGILRAYLSARGQDEKTIKTVLKDETLVETILYGPKPSCPSSGRILETYLKEASVMASK
ncbi:MAG: START domain-containing protein [Desulfatibacillum sp.]|nr:START domain-containing protein [Desulfatibacillum sp.]